MADSGLPSGFKDTEIGPIPVTWQEVKLGGIYEVKQGKALSPKHRRGVNPRRFLRTANVRWGRLDLTTLDEMDFTDKEMETLDLHPDDLLLCEGGEIGRTAIWGAEIDDCYYQNHLHRLRATRPDVCPRFHMYWMQEAFVVQRVYLGTANRTTIPNLSQSRLKVLVLPLPPLPEQRAIASVLSTVQEAIVATEAVIAAARELKRSLMRHLFTYGPVPLREAERVPLKETEIGPVPEHWEVCQLGTLFNLKQGKAMSPRHRLGLNPRPFLRTANVLWGRTDLNSLDEMDFTEQEMRVLGLQMGDLLVCEGGDIGRTAMWPGEMEDCYYQNHLHRLRTSRADVLPAFYMYWMDEGLRQRGLYGGIGNRTTIPNLSQSRVRALAVPLPSKSQQTRVASILQAIGRKIASEENRKQALDALFKSLLHHLMTGKVRVQPEAVLEEETL